MSARKHEWPVFAHLRSFHLGSWSNLMPSFEGCCQSVASCCVKMPPTISIKSHGQDLMLETHWCFRRPMPQAHMWNLSIVPDTAENAYPDAENAYPYAENALVIFEHSFRQCQKRIPICRKRIHHMLKTHRSLDSWCHKQALDLGKKTVYRDFMQFSHTLRFFRGLVKNGFSIRPVIRPNSFQRLTHQLMFSTLTALSGFNSNNPPARWAPGPCSGSKMEFWCSYKWPKING